MPEGGSTCQNGLGKAVFKKLQVAKFRVGQHAGIAQIKLQVSGWVNITGMVGQHSPESSISCFSHYEFSLPKISLSGEWRR